MGNIKVGDDTQVRFGAGSGSGQPGDMNLEFVSADSVLAVTDAAGNVLAAIPAAGLGGAGILRTDANNVIMSGSGLAASDVPTHNHTAADQGGDYPWADITGFGASGAATTVSRDDHVQAVDKGGTGAVTAGAALTNLGAAAADHVQAVDKGGTGATSAAAGLTALGGVAANTAITPGTGTKITADAKGLVTAVANMAASDIPAHTHTAADQGGDYPWADITGFAGSGTATTVPHSDHNHDVTYAPIAHNHDADYASIVHNHDADYADIVHNHDSDYSAIDHVQALDKGGTGAVTAKGARDAIELGATDSPTFAAVTATGTVEAGAFKAPAAAAGYVAHDASGNFIFSQSGVAAGSLPQGLETTDSPEFVGMTLSGLSTAGFVKNNSSGVLSTADIAAADLPAHTHDAANQGGDLALGTMATQAANNVAITGGSVTGTVYAPRTIEVGVTGSAVLDEVGLEDGVLYRCTVTGTPATWAAVSGAAADEKVKYNADDAAAGYLADKIVAGTNVTLAEGTGGDADKLVISATGGGGMTPIVWSLNDAQVGTMVFAKGASMYTDGTGPVKRLVSDGTADQGAQWTGIVPEVTETAEWTLHGYLLPRASEADTTAVVYVIFQKGGGADFLTDAFDDENAVQIDIPATAGYPVAFEIPIVNCDGLVAGDLYRAQVWRQATADGTGDLTDNAGVLDIVGELRVTFAEPEA